MVFGDPASEDRHAISAVNSAVITGYLGQSARVLKPETPAGFWGGAMSFTLRVDPRKMNYLTVKFWGGDCSSDASCNDLWRLQVFIEGKMMGWIDQGPVDAIDMMHTAPRLPGAFFSHTLPLSCARGESSVRLRIASTGRVYPYGSNATGDYYFAMTTPSRGIYRAYTHTDPCFLPGPDDDFGQPAPPGIRIPTDDPAIAAVRARALRDQDALLYGRQPTSMDPWHYEMLCRGYYWPESPAYRNADALELVCQAIDAQYNAWQKDPTALTNSPQQWEGFGRVGVVLFTAWGDLQPSLDKCVTQGPLALLNLGFEGGGPTPQGWTAAAWADHGTLSRDTTITHSGLASAKLVSGGGALTVTSNSRALTGQGTMTYSVWVKTDATAKTPHVLTQFYDAQGAYVASCGEQRTTTGVSGWQQLKNTFTVPANSTQYEFCICVTNNESAWFDDISITAPLPEHDTPVPRRTAYRDMLYNSREYWRRHTRHYTNQNQYAALGVYECNRGLSLVSPADAWPQARAMHWLYISVGLAPFQGNEDEAGNPSWVLGHNYYLVTPKGLSRELGFVGNYGETNGTLARMWWSVAGGAGWKLGADAGNGAVVDERLRDRMVQMCKARSWFRYPATDASGKTCMRMESMIGWRNETYPGDIVYGERADWDSSTITAAATFSDPDLLGYAQEMIADGQFGPTLALQTTNHWSRVGLNALKFLGYQLPSFQAAPASPARLPGRWERADFVFTDEVNACLAVKRGQELFYCSLYFRARQAVNNLARVHLLTPTSERSATIWVQPAFDPANPPTDTFNVQDWVSTDYAINSPELVPNTTAGGNTPPGPALHQAWAGLQLPIAPVPPDCNPTAGTTNVTGLEKLMVGKAPFYFLDYAGYLVAMNTTDDHTFTFDPPRSTHSVCLPSGLSAPIGTITVPPGSTLILFDPSRRPSGDEGVSP
ncbi:Tat pathway signal sequence domain protein [Streptomyces sp. NBC_01283]|uniref:Tat pathway signal sequence domain protein n=1 Tax=Streptomyces sp. NBC_01283 TaxID=2903812 RepID=UPI00352D2944|nr:Tat pathway signal sequence domain protein [Streptomyces sp. NBC_01283]